MMNKIVKSILKAWNNWFLKSPERTVSNRRYSAMTKELKDYLLRHFDFRYNRLTGVTEYRPAGEKGTAFRPIDDREMNGMIIDARLKGMLCRHSDLPTLVLSNNIESYNPFHLYMDELPSWDGQDRVTPLLKLVSENDIWLRGARYWLRAMASQWMGRQRSHANTLTPILISDKQGLGKSTFCRRLLPDALQAYYIDNLNLAPGSNPEKKLVKNGLINLDEFDKISERRHADLKNLLQMLTIPIYRGKRIGMVTEDRLASFIGTTNSREVLTDPSGSRRYLCIEVSQSISEEPIEHKQLYAQLKQEIENGESDHMNREEEKELQRHNRAYYRQTPMEDVFYECFRRPNGQEKGIWLTAAEIFRRMQQYNTSALRETSAKQMGSRLIGIGLKAKHTNHGNYYHVIPNDATHG